MARGTVAILTDFGEGSVYVAQMKAVMLRINRDLNIVDITNSVESGNIRQASFLLEKTQRFFPPGTIFLVVVDPGVGGKRRNIVLKVEDKVFVGPDNGVFSGVVRNKSYEAYLIENENYMSKKISKTFHGRDIFAPVAAYISTGIKLSSIGRRIEEITILENEEVEVGESYIRTNVIFIDKFGNLILNAEESHLKKINVEIGDYVTIVLSDDTVHPAKFVSTYSDVEVGQLALLINSFENLEISINQGSASEKLGIRNSGEEVVISKI